jgi:hypothetical protein
MGIQANFFLVDWNRFLTSLRAAGGLDNYWLGYDDSAHNEITMVSMPGVHESWSAATVPWHLHDSFASQLTDATRGPFETLMEAFGIINGPAATPHDIVEEAESCISMSPTTVARVANVCKEMNYRELRDVFAPHLDCTPHGPFSDYEAFQGYLEGFVDLTERARSQGQGIIVTFDL